MEVIMIKTEELEIIIKKCGIVKSFAPLPDHILGHYSFDGQYYIILINNKIKNLESLYRTVLAEEVGHYRTTIGDITPRKYMCLSDRIEVDKKELLALKWACDFLVPTDILVEIIKNRTDINMEILAEHFMITEKLLLSKFGFMAKIKPVWKIDETRSLCLFNLPSIFVFDTTVNKG